MSSARKGKHCTWMDGDFIEIHSYDLKSEQSSSGSRDDEVLSQAFEAVQSFARNGFLNAGQYKGCASHCIDTCVDFSRV